MPGHPKRKFPEKQPPFSRHFAPQKKPVLSIFQENSFSLPSFTEIPPFFRQPRAVGCEQEKDYEQ
jgi:hypothetical protein